MIWCELKLDLGLNYALVKSYWKDPWRSTTPIPIPVDPAGGHCYLNPTKPCKSWVKPGRTAQ